MEDVEVKDLTGMFLIAVPSLKDPNFEHTVVLICDHSKDGAFGLVINRILLNSFMPLFDWLNIKESVEDMPVFYGGPVKPEQGYILFIPEGRQYSSINIKDHLALTMARDKEADIEGVPLDLNLKVGKDGTLEADPKIEHELMI